jgi:nucleotide-binding universal stress UspA family protein
MIDAGSFKAQHLLSALSIHAAARRCLLLTAGTTGHPTARRISIKQFETLLSVQFRVSQSSDPKDRSYRSLDEVAAELKSLAKFDIVFVDPHHSYEDSIKALDLAEAVLDGDGWMIVHDCFPPYHLTAIDYRPGQWCGSTYAAFRDFAATSGRAWLVIDSDFGLGILGPSDTGQYIDDPIGAEMQRLWLRSGLEARRELLRAHGREILRVVPGHALRQFLKSIAEKRTIDLVALAHARRSFFFHRRKLPNPLAFTRKTAGRALSVYQSVFTNLAQYRPHWPAR